MVTSYVAMTCNTDPKPERKFALAIDRPRGLRSLPLSRSVWLGRPLLISLGSFGFAHEKHPRSRSPDRQHPGHGATGSCGRSSGRLGPGTSGWPRLDAQVGERLGWEGNWRGLTSFSSVSSVRATLDRSDHDYPGIGAFRGHRAALTWRLWREHTAMLTEDARDSCDDDLAEIGRGEAAQIAAGPAAPHWPPRGRGRRDRLPAPGRSPHRPVWPRMDRPRRRPRLRDKRHQRRHDAGSPPAASPSPPTCARAPRGSSSAMAARRRNASWRSSRKPRTSPRAAKKEGAGFHAAARGLGG